MISLHIPSFVNARLCVLHGRTLACSIVFESFKMFIRGEGAGARWQWCGFCLKLPRWFGASLGPSSISCCDENCRITQLLCINGRSYWRILPTASFATARVRVKSPPTSCTKEDTRSRPLRESPSLFKVVLVSSDEVMQISKLVVVCRFHSGAKCLAPRLGLAA